MEIREPRPDEGPAWLRLRERLWPEVPRAELAGEQAEILARRDRNAVFAAASPGGELLGFVEVALRDGAEGCRTHPVGYIEGWYVVPERRRSGLGRRLVEEAERWARARGCTEMASDAEIDNALSHGAHRALGYREVTRLILFRKTLEGA